MLAKSFDMSMLVRKMRETGLAISKPYTGSILKIT